MTNPTPDAALLWAREQIKKHAHESLHDAIDAGGWDRWETVHNRAEAFRAGQSHADAGLLEALEDIIEQSAIGNFDATEIARAAIAAAKGAGK